MRVVLRLYELPRNKHRIIGRNYYKEVVLPMPPQPGLRLDDIPNPCSEGCLITIESVSCHTVTGVVTAYCGENVETDISAELLDRLGWNRDAPANRS